MAALPCPRETQRGAGDRGRNHGGHEIGIGVWSRSAAWLSPRPRCMRFHCCEIRACTGARLAEISGLEVQDVDLQEMTINIRFNATRRLKNDPSVRTVPVVDKRAIEALRGQDCWQEAYRCCLSAIRARGGPDSASAALSKWLTRIGLRDTLARIPKRTHSFRHAFKDGLRDAGVHRDVANMIQGHTAGDEASKYGSSELLSRKREAAEQVWKLLPAK